MESVNIEKEKQQWNLAEKALRDCAGDTDFASVQTRDVFSQIDCLVKLEKNHSIKRLLLSTVQVLQLAQLVSQNRSLSDVGIKLSVRKDSSVGELDSFGASRKCAIEQTLVVDRDDLPRLEDIAGLAEAKKSLAEAVLDPTTYPEWFAESGVQPWRCILLYGPPGTGKSHLAQGIAREINCSFYRVSSSDLISSWSGQSEKLIRELFEHARQREDGAIIFVDEIDSLCRRRNSREDDNNRRVKTELLVQLERMQRESKQVVFVSATNCPWELDAAFLRRFEKRIYVPLPDPNARITLVKRLLSKCELSGTIDWDLVVKGTEGLSGDDLRCVCREVAFQPLRHFKLTGIAHKLISEQDFLSVLATQSPTVSQATLNRYDQFLSNGPQ